MIKGGTMKNIDISKLLNDKDRITIDIVGDSITWGLLIAALMKLIQLNLQ